MSRGFSLVEVVMALGIFGFVSLAAGALLESAARSTREAESRERLLWVADTALDSLRRRGLGSPGEIVLPDGARVRWGPGSSGSVLEAWPANALEPWLSAPVGGFWEDDQDG